MATQKTNFRTQVLAILAVRHGRELGEQIAKMHDAPIGDLPQSSLSAMIRRLDCGEVTDGRDLIALEALRLGLAERLCLEVVGSKIEARSVGYDEDGEIWDMIEVPAYSNQGEKAWSLYQRLERFVEVRQQLIDYANAERLAMRLLR